MKKCITGLILVLLFIAVFAQSQEQAIEKPEIEVYFSPRGGCQAAIIREIENAEKQVLVQAYSFTNADIAKALLEAKKRGVEVEVILDKSQETAKYSRATFFHNMGISLLIDDKHTIAHNKIMIIDGNIVITGSYNFSESAEERNAENLLILKGFEGVTKKYLGNYEVHRIHSRSYQRLPSEKK